MVTAHTDFLGAFADGWLAAWNSHDTEQVLALAHPDIQWDDRTFWPDVIHGIEGLREYTDAIWRAMPDVRFDELGRFFAPDAEQGIVLFRQTGSAPPRLRTDKRFDSHGCDIFLRFEDGLLREYLASYDISRMLEQLGSLPPRDGKLGGAWLVSAAGARA